jgi:flagellar biosynthesis/type III secretory pathway protein FliH
MPLTQEERKEHDDELARARAEGEETGRQLAQMDAHDEGYRKCLSDIQPVIDEQKAQIAALTAQLEFHTGGCCGGDD